MISTSSADNRNFGGGYTTLLAHPDPGCYGGIFRKFNAVALAKPVNVSDLTLYSAVQSVYGFVNFGFSSTYEVHYGGMGGPAPLDQKVTTSTSPPTLPGYVGTTRYVSALKNLFPR